MLVFSIAWGSFTAVELKEERGWKRGKSEKESTSWLSQSGKWLMAKIVNNKQFNHLSKHWISTLALALIPYVTVCLMEILLSLNRQNGKKFRKAALSLFCLHYSIGSHFLLFSSACYKTYLRIISNLINYVTLHDSMQTWIFVIVSRSFYHRVADKQKEHSNCLLP